MTDPRPARSATPGTVHLVGAGPGDPDLMTVKARRLIDDADVVFADALVGDGIRASIPPDVTVRDVGKRPDGETTSQAEINRLLVEAARAGKAVVRLKGGDPMVFARGGEEAEFLAERDVPIEIIPGVTSAVAAPGVAGVPVTHRECASSLTIVTGHEDPTKAESALNWDALVVNVQAGGTLAILMGVGRLPDNVETMREAGLDPDTPVAMVERATLNDERVVDGTLATIVEAAEAAGIEPPAVTVVGEVVEIRSTVREALGAAGGRTATGLDGVADGARPPLRNGVSVADRGN